MNNATSLTLTSYVPRLIIRRLAKQPEPLRQAQAERFPAAVLFADITEFTRLSEKVTQSSQDRASGAEKIATILNLYFEPLIEQIHACGGEVVKFAGDALLALWTVDKGQSFKHDEELKTATQQAAYCGLQLQKKLHNYEVMSGVRVAMQIGIGTGFVSAVYVGGVYDRWEFLLSGDPLSQMSQAESYAESGQVIVSPEAWELVADIAEGRPLTRQYHHLTHIAEPTEFPQPEPISLPPFAQQTLTAYIPGAIRDALFANLEAWVAEIRQVSLLFIHLPDYGTSIRHPYNETLPQAQTVMHTLQTILYKYEGSINKLNVDDKGVTLVAALGLPPVSHEDDPLRAVKTAVEMHQALQNLGRECAIGLTTGEVFCGPVGHPQRREYTMMGDATNLASRLMQHMQTHRTEKHLNILCDEATYHATRQHLIFDRLRPIRVKGKQKKVRVFRPRLVNGHVEHISSATSAHNHKGAFVGREEELAFLEEKLLDLKEGSESCTTIVLQGEAGLGKSVLLNQVVEKSKRFNILTFTGKGRSHNKNIPFAVWHNILHQLFDMTAVLLLPETERQKHILQMMPTGTGEKGFPIRALQFAALLNPLLGVAFGESKLTKDLSGELRQQATHEFLIKLLPMLIQKQTPGRQASPILLAVDNVHLLDKWSRNLLIALTNTLSHAICLIATRQFPDVTIPATHTLELKPLKPDACLEMISHYLQVSHLPKPMVAYVHDQAEGHPLYSQAVVDTLRNGRFIHIQNGECHLTDTAHKLDTVPLPQPVQKVIINRMDRLSLEQQLLLKAASVIGYTFSLSLLEAIYPIDIDTQTLQQHLKELIQLGLLQHEQGEQYAFRFRLTQRGTYMMLLGEQRRILHRQAALWYETLDNVDLFLDELILHWSKVILKPEPHPETYRLMRYFEHAGKRALGNFEYTKAQHNLSELITFNQILRFTPQASSYTISDQQLGVWWRYLSLAFRGIGQLHQSQNAIEKALVLWEQELPSPSVRFNPSWLGQIWVQIQHRLQSTHHLVIREETETLQQQRLIATAYCELAELHYLSNHRTLALNASLRALNLAEQGGVSPELARAYAVMCATIATTSEPLARAYRRRALTLISEMNHPSANVHVWLLTSVYDMGTANWQAVATKTEKVVTYANETGDLEHYELALFLKASVAHFRGLSYLAQPVLRTLYKSALEREHHLHQAWSLSLEGAGLLRAGDLIKGIKQLESALLLYEQTADEIGKTAVRGWLAYGYACQHKLETALRLADSIIAYISRQPATSYHFFAAYSGACEAYLLAWQEQYEQQTFMDHASTGRRTQKVISLMKGFAKDFEMGVPRAYLYEGWYEFLLRRRNKAYKLWRRGIQEAQKRNMIYEEARLHAMLGEYLTKGEENRKVHLLRARVLMQQAKAMGAVQKLDALIINITEG